MAQRTFGWIQNPSSVENLKNTVGILVSGSKVQEDLINNKIPFLIEYNLASNPAVLLEYAKRLSSGAVELPYEELKGKGAGSEGRKNAKCSGIVQAVITAQKSITVTNNAGESITVKKPYTDDWTADGFLRWAISIGLLEYDNDKDTCKVTEIGERLVNAESDEETNEILGEAYLSYPPVVRVLNLLKEGGHLTKFEIGRNLGFIGEAGFTSIPQNIWVAGYCDESDPTKKSKIRSDEEGSSDKYARMICGWLCGIGWVQRTPKTVEVSYGGNDYSCEIGQSYVITMEGLRNLKKAYGTSKLKRVPKIVFFEMLATKTQDVQYVRLRRAHIIKYTNIKERSLEQIQEYLKNKGIEESISCIKDDIDGLVGIGLTFTESRGQYKLVDEICNLEIPVSIVATKTDVSIIKDRVRERLSNLDHKYLTLIDLSFGGNDTDRDFEIQTIDLLTNELKYNGKRLGDTRKPDGIIYYNENGLIIDNKAYSEGYSLPRAQADEMVRYLQENNDRNPARNPNEWWNEFDSRVNKFNFVFISSLFKGRVEERLNEISISTGVNGAVLNSENLLYLAEGQKSGAIGYSDSFGMFDKNQEIIL